MWQRIFSRGRGARRRDLGRTRFQAGFHLERLEQRALLTASPVGELLTAADFVVRDGRMPTATAVTVADSGIATVVFNTHGIAGARTAGNDVEILMRRYGADGNEVGSATIANQVTRGQQISPSIASAADGSYWVVWSGRGAGDRVGVFAQRFDANGSRMGTTLLVNQTIGGDQIHPDVVVAGDGTAVVVWQGVGTGDFDGIFARVISASGTFLTGETLVNQNTTGSQVLPSVALANFSGSNSDSDVLRGFLVTWSSRNEDGSGWGIFARGFNANGTPAADAFRVNTMTVGSQHASDVVSDEDGAFTIAWSSFSAASGWDVMARQYAATGTPLGVEFMLPTQTAGQQKDVALAMAPAGELMAVWSHAEPNGSGWQVQGRTLDADGTPDGTVFSVVPTPAAATLGNQLAAAVGLNANGNSMVTFVGEGGAGRPRVFGQRYDVDVVPAENVAPLLTAIPDQRITIGQTLSVTVQATDANSRDTLTYRLDPTLSPSTATIQRVNNNTATITWTPTIDDRDPTQSATSIGFRLFVDDDGSPPLSDSASFLVFIDNLAPTLDLNGPNQAGTGFEVTLPNNQGQIAIVSPQLTVADVDQVTIAGATVTIRNPDDRDAESLMVDTLDTSIVQSYDSVTARLTLTGNDTPANYQRVLRTLMYQTTLIDRGQSSQRVIDVIANDGVAQSAAAVVNLVIQGDNSVPQLEAIADVALLSGSPLHIPLVASDLDGDTLTFTVTSSNLSVMATVPTGNRSARITVDGFGEMVFEMFEDRAPRATEQIIQLAQDGFYEGIVFHRVARDGMGNPFVIQAGDPTATGSGGSSLPNFDDQFHPTLQHNRSGVWSMAKSVDDSNNSQFFITAGPTRFLDFNHTIFGQLVVGDSVRAAIQDVPVGANDRPLTDVVISSFEIFVDNQNGLLMLSAPQGTEGSTLITVTVSDGKGGSAMRQFNVTVTPDTFDNPPFLADIPQLQTPVNTPLTFQLEAIDVEGDEVVFLDQAAMIARGIMPLQFTTSADLQYSVDPATGLLTVTPTNNLTGTHRFTVGVIQSDLHMTQGFSDLQVVEIVIGP